MSGSSAASKGPHQAGSRLRQGRTRVGKGVEFLVHCALLLKARPAGNIATPGGKSIAGPQAEWKGRRHGPSQARRWSKVWSPEQIANRLLMDFPEDTSMRISHEAIYQALYVRDQREHQRPAAAILPEGNRPQRPQDQRTECSGPCIEHEAAQDARLADTGRSIQ